MLKNTAFALISILAFLTNIQKAQAVSLRIPIGGTPYQDWTIVNYVDLDPGSGLGDYRGGNYTYNGHDAIDFTLPNFVAMERGVSVYASFPGTVISVRDSEPDRCSTENPCSTPANFIENRPR